MEPGTFEGQHYDGKMTNILFNHAAIVEEGRVEGAVVGDSASERGWARLGHILEAVLFGGALDREYKRAPDGRFGSVAGSPGTGIISKGSPLAMKEKAAKVAAKAPKAEKKASAPKAAPKEKAPKAEKSKAKKKPGLSKSDWSKYNDYWSKYDTDADKEAIGAPAEKPKAEKKASAPTPRDPLATSLENLQAKTKFDRRTFLAHVVEKISADNAKIARLPKSQQTLPKLIAFYEPKLGKAKLESIALIVANENSVVH
jgi:hypothetical protein